MQNNYPRTKQIRFERRERAVSIQLANARTPQEQLAHLDKMGFIAAKERAKIAQKLRMEENLPPKKVKKVIDDSINGHSATVWTREE